ncbi:MAG: MCE family protein [Chitinophagales bacterium]|jgi:phospholipid/cholesterol/gamma-HCH transport system substrate-binding protein|nr:MCE family protein [Chitinophagales bacterium]
MAKQTINNIKLGLFVIAGFAFFMLMLYWVGKDTNMFSSNIILKARFQNVNGLMPGNNVRSSGIQVGTVRTITFINDSTIEIEMAIDEEFKKFISKNALVNIGSEGLMGNKIVNIIPGKGEAPEVVDGDLLASKKNPDTDEMLKILYETNNMVAQIAVSVKSTVDQVNNSTTIWSLLNDAAVSSNIKTSLVNIKEATEDLSVFMEEMELIAHKIESGNGPAGTIINDTTISSDLITATKEIRIMASDANKMIQNLSSSLQEVTDQIKNGEGTAQAVLSDTAMVNKLNRTLDNIEQGTKAFNENMEALKHSALLKGYFRKKEK